MPTSTQGLTNSFGWPTQTRWSSCGTPSTTIRPCSLQRASPTTERRQPRRPALASASRPLCNHPCVTAVVLRDASVADAGALADLHRRTALHAYANIFPAEAPKPTVEMLMADWEARLGVADRRQACYVAERDA